MHPTSRETPETVATVFPQLRPQPLVCLFGAHFASVLALLPLRPRRLQSLHGRCVRLRFRKGVRVGAPRKSGIGAVASHLDHYQE